MAVPTETGLQLRRNLGLFFFLDSTINVTDKGVVLMESNQETHFAVHPPYYVLHLLKGIQLEEGTAAEQTVLHASMA